MPEEERGKSNIAQRGKSTAIEEKKERDIRRTFKILREVWLDIGIEKVNMYKGIERGLEHVTTSKR